MTPAETKSWTLLAYLVADDQGGFRPLDAGAEDEIGAMFKAVESGDLYAAAQVDFKRTRGVFRATVATPREFEPVNPQAYASWRKLAHRLEDSELLLKREREDLNAANAGVLRDFLADGLREYPAHRYAILFYGHSFGPMGLFYDSGKGCPDPNTLRLPGLADALRSNGSPAEIVMFRDCFMGNLETVYELKEAARFVIATQAQAPIAGTWPWSDLVAELMNPGELRAEKVARRLACRLGDFHDREENRGGFADVPWSLVDVGAVHLVAAPLAALTNALEAARNNPALGRACSVALESARRGSPGDPAQPGDPALLDIQTMCDNLQKVQHQALAPLAAELARVVRTHVVTWHYAQQGVYRGLSLFYMPLKEEDRIRSVIVAGSDADIKADCAYYQTLALSKATGWDRIAVNPLGAASVDPTQVR